MSNGKGNEMARSLLRSQTAKELENQLLRLRKGELSRRKMKAREIARRTLSTMKLELPTVQSPSAHAILKTTHKGHQG